MFEVSNYHIAFAIGVKFQCATIKMDSNYIILYTIPLINFIILKHKHGEMDNEISLVVYLTNRNNITTKSIINRLYVEYFYLNDKK
jgi:hypothetical protein